MAKLRPYGDSMANRAHLLLQSLRNDPKYANGVIVSEDQEFPVHTGIVSEQSPFFAAAFGEKSLGVEQKRCNLEDAPKAAVKLIIDYMFCAQVNINPTKDYQLVLDVWKLAHRYQIDELKQMMSEMAMKYPQPEKCVALLKYAKLYGEDYHELGARFYIARNLAECYKKCEEFHKLELEDFRQVLSGSNLIAKEYDKLCAILAWDENVFFDESKYVRDLLSRIRFDELDEAQLMYILRKNVLPQYALIKAVIQLARAKKKCDTCNKSVIIQAANVASTCWLWFRRQLSAFREWLGDTIYMLNRPMN